MKNYLAAFTLCFLLTGAAFAEVHWDGMNVNFTGQDARRPYNLSNEQLFEMVLAKNGAPVQRGSVKLGDSHDSFGEDLAVLKATTVEHYRNIEYFDTQAKGYPLCGDGSVERTPQILFGEEAVTVKLDCSYEYVGSEKVTPHYLVPVGPEMFKPRE